MRRLLLRIELVNAREEDYIGLRADLEKKGFQSAEVENPDRAAQFTFTGNAEVEAVAQLAQKIALTTRKRFLIFVSDSQSQKGVGIVG